MVREREGERHRPPERERQRDSKRKKERERERDPTKVEDSGLCSCELVEIATTPFVVVLGRILLFSQILNRILCK